MPSLLCVCMAYQLAGNVLPWEQNGRAFAPLRPHDIRTYWNTCPFTYAYG